MKYERPISQSLAPFSSRINCLPSGFTYATTRGVYAGQRPGRCVKGSFLALITGPGSVFECLIIALFSRSDICSKPASNALYIADYMIALMWQSCNGERAASHTRGFGCMKRPVKTAHWARAAGSRGFRERHCRSRLDPLFPNTKRTATIPKPDLCGIILRRRLPRFLLLGASPCYETRA